MHKKVHYYVDQRCCVLYCNNYLLSNQLGHANYMKEGPPFVRKDPIPTKLPGHDLGRQGIAVVKV